MIKKLIFAGLPALSLFFGACRHETELQLNLSDKFEGQTVELIDFNDSIVIASAQVKDGNAAFVLSENDSVKFPLFTQVVIDGRVRAFYVAEEGKAMLNDSVSVASGTPLNDRFGGMLVRLDSVEALDDMALYVDFAREQYDANRDNVLGPYFGVEYLKYADPEKVDSLLAKASPGFRASRKVKYYENFARLRSQTSPGQKYVDFKGEDAVGNSVDFSNYVIPGKYTLVDFWASWCPYCIKELPQLAEVYSEWKDKGLEIVGVAVRDNPADTKGAVEKYGITWPVVYNTQRIPYDIYGFSGIPHHILIGPDGTIISRGESAQQIGRRLQDLLPQE